MYQLLVIRHGLAGNQKSFYQGTRLPDEERPLTNEGKTQIENISAFLPNLVQPTRFASSPLKRAVQTIRILGEPFGAKEFETWKELRPSCHPVEFLDYWGQNLQKSEETLAIAGHEPNLSSLVSFLLSGGTKSFVHMKKGTVALLRFHNSLKPGGASLQWYMSPEFVRNPS